MNRSRESQAFKSLGRSNRFDLGWRLAVITSALALLVAETAAAGDGETDDQPPPNVVLIVADDLGWADLGCYGADLHETPHLDRLASGAVSFCQAYAATPACSPTRASIMTGKSPARLHMTVWYEAARRPPGDHPLVPPTTIADLPHAEIARLRSP